MIAREPRQKVVLPARMRAGAGQAEICIRDVSTRGMLAQADAPPVRGTYVEILRPACTIVGLVVWSNGRRFGIQTRERIVLSAVLERRTVLRSGDTGPGAPLVQAMPAKRWSAPAERTADRSRALSNRLQNGVFAAGGAVAALSVAVIVYQQLARVVLDATAGLA